MKTLVATVTLLFFITLGCGKEAGPEVDFSALGHIGHSKGKVYVLRTESAAPLAAKPGLVLQKGDVVKTKNNGKIEIVFGSGAVLKLAKNTTLELNNFLGDGTLRTNLREGKALSIFRKAKKNTRISMQTPTAVAGVRGTSFLTGVEGNKTIGFPFGAAKKAVKDITTQIKVITGKVSVKGKRKKGDELILTPKTELEFQGLKLEKKLIKPLQKTSIEELKEMINLESTGLQSLKGLLDEIKYTTAVLLGKAFDSATDLQSQEKKLLNQEIAPKTKVKTLKETGKEIDKDYDSEELKLQKDVF